MRTERNLADIQTILRQNEQLHRAVNPAAAVPAIGGFGRAVHAQEQLVLPRFERVGHIQPEGRVTVALAADFRAVHPKGTVFRHAAKLEPAAASRGDFLHSKRAAIPAYGIAVEKPLRPAERCVFVGGRKHGPVVGQAHRLKGGFLRPAAGRGEREAPAVHQRDFRAGHYRTSFIRR